MRNQKQLNRIKKIRHCQSGVVCQEVENCQIHSVESRAKRHIRFIVAAFFKMGDLGVVDAAAASAGGATMGIAEVD